MSKYTGSFQEILWQDANKIPQLTQNLRLDPTCLPRKKNVFFP